MISKRRTAIVGAIASVVVAAAVFAWWRREHSTTSCCPGAGPAALDDSIAVDPSVRSGTLPNGIRYYIVANRSTDARDQLRLVVNAGSVLEDDDQRGLAHAVEHMALRDTRHFPAGAIERFFERVGMRRGEGVNASTSLDETVYRMAVPSNRPGAVDTALAMLASVAHEATFDGVHDSAQAGILIEEWRSQRDAFQRIADARHSLIFAGTPYAARPVIGDTTVLRRFDIRAMRRFYDTWYRPERMAVVAVGEFDTEEVERTVTRYFGSLPGNPSPPRHLVPSSPAPARALRASIVTDPEATDTWIGFWYPLPNERYRLRSDYRSALIASLWRTILRERLEDVSEEAASPIVSPSTERRYLARPLGAEVVSVVVKKDRALDAVEVVATEVERLARYGPTRREIDGRATRMLRYARGITETGDGSADLASELVDHYLTGNAPINNRMAYELVRDILPTIQPDDVTKFARALSIDSGAMVIADAMSNDAVAKATPAELVARTRDAIARPIARPSREPDVRRLLVNEPTPGRVVAERAIAEVHAYEWTLSNGMRVILKPTSFTFDAIQLRAVATGGASLASDADYPSAYLSDAIIKETGVGPLPGTRLDRWLESTSIAMGASVSDDAVAIVGSTAPRDLDPFFQLLHLYLTSPRRDTVAFQRYRDRSISFLRNRRQDPDAVFRDTLASALASGDPRAVRNTVGFFESANLTTAIDFWMRRVSNAADFTVVLTGDFTLDRLRPLVERYLASLPRGVHEEPRGFGRRIVAAPVNREVDSGIGGVARTAIGLTGAFDVTSDAMAAIGAVRDVLAVSLQKRLRDELGGTYSVSVSLDVDVVPPARWIITIDFTAAPERVESLTAAAFAEIERLRIQGPTTDEFTNTRAARIRDYDGEIDDNDYWTSELSSHSRFGWSLASIAEHQREAERLTLAELRVACAAYIPNGRYVRVTMRPHAVRGSTSAR